MLFPTGFQRNASLPRRTLGLWLLAACLSLCPGQAAADETPPGHLISAWLQQPAAECGTVLRTVEEQPPTSPPTASSEPTLQAIASWPWLQTLLVVGALSLVPAIAMMTTSYIRVFIVLSLLRQAIGAANLPPNQVIAALALFISLLVMAPTWRHIKHDVVDPMTSQSEELTWDEAWTRTAVPVKRFMYRQIEAADNLDNIWMLASYLPEDSRPKGQITVDEIPLEVLLPAFVISELKVAFLIGFQIYLPFLVLDLVIAAVTVSMGMVMVPPAVIAVPLKLILFVLADGWTLVVGMLLDSFAWDLTSGAAGVILFASSP